MGFNRWNIARCAWVIDCFFRGFDAIWISEHYCLADGYLPALLPMAAHIAARTARVRIGTSVLLLPFHDPLRVAEDAAVVDILSGGRLDLGIGLGSRAEEFPGFGFPRRQRPARFAEHRAIRRGALHPIPRLRRTARRRAGDHERTDQAFCRGGDPPPP
ncbi:MAG: LLM class flavin-dependent oxidoreductase [Dehalococcoidia bacterium]